MKTSSALILIVFVFLIACKPNDTSEITLGFDSKDLVETEEQFDERMKWWREARFGMFIHWGLYAIPAGEWEGVKTHGEWIRTTAQIPMDTYDQFINQFNPVEFNAEEWAKMAYDAGMKYMVITSKHHDGFCLWDSKYTDFDVMSTPFKRDILKELSEACAKYNIRLGFYHSIMDWHHPDYKPAREWEKDVSKEKADYSRYVEYMKSQLEELATSYGDIAVFWYDGEWEDTWTHDHGKDLYEYTRSLSPKSLINNRVDKGRGGMAGMTSEGYLGDFGTPEQEIPATGIAGVDWESCMTMNDHWGYNQSNDNWKSAEDLIRKLTDIASKGGNYLLNVGPMANGNFPKESIDRLAQIGKWMDVNGEAIYGTSASPFEIMDWGRVTFKKQGMIAKIYLHIFDWQLAKKGISLPGMADDPTSIVLLSDKDRKFEYARDEDQLQIQLTGDAVDHVNTVIELTFDKIPDIFPSPLFEDDLSMFIKNKVVRIELPSEDFNIRYTIDGKRPSNNSPLYDNNSGIQISSSCTIKARMFKGDNPISGFASKEYKKVTLNPAINLLKEPSPGISYSYYEGDWDKVPDFMSLVPISTGKADQIENSPKQRDEKYGILYSGYISIAEDGIFTFITESDDGSKLYIDGQLIVDNDGLHGMEKKEGSVALAKGYHNIIVSYFENTGGDDLKVQWKESGGEFIDGQFFH